MKHLLVLLISLFSLSCSSQGGESAQGETIIERVGNAEWNKRIAQEEGEVLLVDVRTPREFHAGHLEGAVNIDFKQADFLQQMQALDKERTLYIYCHSGGRSGRALSMLSDSGWKRIIELRSGYSNWEP